MSESSIRRSDVYLADSPGQPGANPLMSLLPPHLPSPATTPDPFPGQQHPPLPAQQTAADDDQTSLRAELEAVLLRLSQDLYEMEICAGEVGQGMEGAVPDYLYRINQSYRALSDLMPNMTDTVPRQVIDFVDNYRNPHLYTKNTLSRATGENQYALGRVLGLESFRRQLGDAIGAEFPDVPLPDRRHKPSWEVAREDARGSGRAASREEEVKVEQVEPGPEERAGKGEDGGIGARTAPVNGGQ